MFEPDDLLLALSGAQVEFIVIGGVAVGVHGFVRATKDLDIVPNPGREIRVCGLDHLRAMKQTAGRSQDLTDLRNLEGATG